MKEKLLAPFVSISLNSILFAVIVVAAAWGTFLPPDSAVTIYHSWWFLALLELMVLNTILCKLRKWPQSLLANNATLPQQSVEYQSSLRLEEAVAAIEHRLPKKGWRWRQLTPGTFDGRHHILQKWGSWLVHISVVGFLLGGIITARFGFEEFQKITEGGTVTLDSRPLTIQLKKFEVEFHPQTGTPRSFTSHVLISRHSSGSWNPGSKPSTKKGGFPIETFGNDVLYDEVISVNHPLTVEGLSFSQATWGMTPQFRAAEIQIGQTRAVVRQGDILAVPGAPYQLRANAWAPSLVISPDGKATVSMEPSSRPALQIDFLKGSKIQSRLWLVNGKERTAYEITGDKLTPLPPPPLEFLSISPIYYSGIQIRHDPGAPFFGVGATLLIIGLFLHFYLHRKELRIIIRADGPYTKILCLGADSRNAPALEREFMDFAKKLADENLTRIK